MSDRPLAADDLYGSMDPAPTAPISARPLAKDPAPPTEVPGASSILADRMAASSRRLVRRRHRQRLLVGCAQLVVLVAVLALWETASRRGWIDPTFYSRPSDIGRFLVDERSLFVENAIATFHATAIGFAIGSLGGIAVGLLLARFDILNRTFDPYLMALNSLPRIALVPLFLLWFGITFEAKVANAISLVFFILLINTRTGLRGVDPDLVLEGRLLHGSPVQVYRKILLPAALPSIASGLRLGVTYALLGVIASEMVASRDGLGQQVTLYGQTLRPEGVFATLLVLAVIASVLIAVVKRVEARVMTTHGT
jgi:NitT/TauT family transport system permease protein